MVMDVILKNLQNHEILLASASPRRRELLGQIGVTFSVAPTIEVDESYPQEIPSDDIAQYISKKKADAYKHFLSDNQLIITADTVVINNGKVLGKPANEEDAFKMISSLSGHIHKVVTGVTITSKTKQVSFSASTDVEFATLCDDEINYYIERYKPMDKAGAYGIQEWIGCIGIRNINGSYYNVMGLPLHRLYNELKRF